jgi:hypothetical protein
MALLHPGAGEIIEKEVLAACRLYKVEPQTARKIFTELWAAFPDLDDALNAGKDPCRLAAYKQFVKKARKGIYYQLRRYKGDSADIAQLCELLRQNAGKSPDSGPVAQIVSELLAAHVSTVERTPYYKDFYSNLFAAISPPKSILDIGCGLHPLSYPFFCRAWKKTLPLHCSGQRPGGHQGAEGLFRVCAASSPCAHLRGFGKGRLGRNSARKFAPL